METTQITPEEETEEGAEPVGRFLSQKDYRPTPYRQSVWEIVGERVKERHFVPLSVGVIEREGPSTDPMFEDFGHVVDTDKEQIWHGPKGFHYEGEKTEVKKAPEIDPAMLEAERALGFEEGYVVGKEEAQAEAQAQIAERYTVIEERVKRILVDLQTQVRGFYAKVEKESLKLSLDIARRILVTTTEVKPDYIVEVIREALKCCGSARPLKVRVAQQDLEFIDIIGLPAELSEQELGIKYVGDDSIKSGCIIETDFGEVDLTVEKMWEQVKESIFQVTS